MLTEIGEVLETVGHVTALYVAVISDLWSAHVTGEDLAVIGFLGMLVLCFVVENRRPFLRPSIRAMKRSYRTNVATFLANDLTLSLMSIPSFYYVAEFFSGAGLLSSWEDGPAKYLVTFLLLDFAFYAWHYATHHCDALWVFHKVHHSDRCLNVTTGLRYHVGELFLESLVRMALIIIIGVNANVMLVSQSIISLFVLFHHANVTFPGERLLSYLLIVPRLHRVHHSALREEHDSNYGAVFSVWDRLFGTLREKASASIGLSDVEEQGFLDLVKFGLTTRVTWVKEPIPVVVERQTGESSRR